MQIQLDNYEWQLEGDLQASVWLDLFFEVQVRHHKVEAITLLTDETNCRGVTFSRGRGHEIICDGESGPDLPDALWMWFIERFHEAYETVKAEIEEQVTVKAVQESYEPE